MLFWLLSGVASAQEPWGAPAQVPPEVRYQTTDANSWQGAADLLRRVLASDYAGEQGIFGKVVAVGPFLWERLRQEPRFLAPDGPPMVVQPYGVVGKGFRTPEGIRMVEADLRAQMAQDGGFRLRRPTREEIALYWALIPFDIVEPLFIAETAHHKYLLHFVEGRVLTVDDYQEASFERLRQLGAAGPPVPFNRDSLEQLDSRPQGERTLDKVLLLMDESIMSRRVPRLELLAYLGSLESAVETAKAPPLLMQVELSAVRPPLIQVAGKPELAETDRAKLEQLLAAVPAPAVQGPVVFQLLLRRKKP